VFILADFLTFTTDEIFDFAFCSGALSLNLPFDNYDFLRAMISKMRDLTKVGLAFNFLTSADGKVDPDLFSYETEKVIKICHEIDSFWTVKSEKTPNKAQDTVFFYQ